MYEVRTNIPWKKVYKKRMKVKIQGHGEIKREERENEKRNKDRTHLRLK